MKSWNIDNAALRALEIGAGILGTGGGGNPYLGRLMVESELRQGRTVTIAPIESVPDDALVTSVGGMGAPVISIERPPRGDEYALALRALERHLGQRFTHIVPGEIGGSNSMRPMMAAAQTGLPVVDGDGMGRAFPELQMCTFLMGGIAPAPASLCDYNGQSVIFERVDSPIVLERYARALTIQMGGAAGYAFPVMSGKDLKRTVVPGTMTLARKLGEAVIDARDRKIDPVGAALGVLGGQRIFDGKIVDVARRLEGGFARGTVTLSGTGENDGRTLSIEFQNENLIARLDTGESLAVVPDLICIVDEESAAPISTEILRYGLRVAVLTVPAPEQLKTDAALAVVGPRAFGYDIDFVPMPGTFGSGLEGFR